MSANLAISPAESKEFNLDFTRQNFEYLINECLRLKRQRTEDLITINKKSAQLIEVKNELIGLYLNKPIPSKLEFTAESYTQVVLENMQLHKEKNNILKNELASIKAENHGAVMYINK